MSFFIVVVQQYQFMILHLVTVLLFIAQRFFFSKQLLTSIFSVIQFLVMLGFDVV